MSVDYALILAAGKGTRMGEIGKVVPKVIWPIFDKSILELEVEYARSLGAKKIYINLYNYQEKIIDFCKNKSVFDGVEFIIEKEELDIGGAVHNLAKELNYTGNLLILNSDQFIILEKKIQKQFISEIESSNAVLLVYDVEKKDGYNELIIENDTPIGIRQNSNTTQEVFATYTGMSLVKLSALKIVSGKSKFFDTVVRLGDETVKTTPIANSEYWDFGTTERYLQSIFKLIKEIQNEESSACSFSAFLTDAKAVDLTGISKNSYKSDRNGQLIFGDFIVEEKRIEYKKISNTI